MSWFAFDVISIIPFDIILQFSSYNRLIRISRLGKIYKVLRLTKLARLIKSVKMADKKNSSNLTELLKIDIGLERILVMALNVIALIHLSACMWVMIGQFEPSSKVNWIYMKDLEDET